MRTIPEATASRSDRRAPAAPACWREWLAAESVAIEKGIRDCVRHRPGVPSSLLDAMRYSLFPGGKRLRPALTVLGHRAFGGGHPDIYRLGAVFELAHTFSLIHDDLPCMDDDDFRRGRPSCHKAYSEALAVLAGDALLNLSYEMIGHLECEDSSRARILRLVSGAMGGGGVLGGQVDDIAGEGCDLSESDLRSIHLRKTAALFRAALCAGGELAGASAKGLSELDAFGREYGLLFQVVDDLMDVEGDASVLGRPGGGDARHEKATYPRILGIEPARRKARALERTTTRRALGLPSHGAILADLVKETIRRGAPKREGA